MGHAHHAVRAGRVLGEETLRTRGGLHRAEAQKAR